MAKEQSAESAGASKETAGGNEGAEKATSPKIEPKKGAVKPVDKNAKEPVGCQIGVAGVTTVIPNDEKSKKEYRCNHCGKALGNDWPHKVTGIGQPENCPKVK